MTRNCLNVMRKVAYALNATNSSAIRDKISAPILDKISAPIRDKVSAPPYSRISVTYPRQPIPTSSAPTLGNKMFKPTLGNKMFNPAQRTPVGVGALSAAGRSVPLVATGASGFVLGNHIGKKLVEQPNIGQKMYVPSATDAELREAMKGVESRRAAHGLPALTNSKYSVNYNPGMVQSGVNTVKGWFGR